MPRFLLLICYLVVSTLSVHAASDLRLPALFSDGAILQRNMEIPVWGWAAPGAVVTVEFADASVETQADEQGRWRVALPALDASFEARTLQVNSETESLAVSDVLVGEVWVCSGQSNMEWPLKRSYDLDLESRVSRFPALRLIRVPRNGTQELQDDFEGSWEAATPESVLEFTAVGYLFGRWIHDAAQVPVGLIQNGWGGSRAEAWVRRDLLERDARFEDMMEEWRTLEADDPDRSEEERDQREKRLKNQHRPGNLYAGMLHPIAGYGIRGIIWYQGESNVARAWEYRWLFPLLIHHWRDTWGQGDFPFYWVQLANYQAVAPVPDDSNWAELRESQTLALALPNTGQAVIYDVGEGRDIHPRDKQTVARRLARLALARDYGFDIVHRSPMYDSMEITNGVCILRFTDVGRRGLYAYGHPEPLGFAIAGEDRVWRWAQAKVASRDTVEVSHPDIPNPVAVRYAWANNPVATLESYEGLPVTPFRTDDWPLTTQPAP